MAPPPTHRSELPVDLPVWPDARVLVVGLGVSGLWTARWLAQQGAHVMVSEIKPASELNPSILNELSALGVGLETGGHREGILSGVDMLIVSPGVPLDIPLVRSAWRRHIPVIGELELASRIIRSPIIAITGTNGKSTVTAMVGELLQNGGKRAFVGGNIGTPLMAYAARGEDADYVVAEVSSFQLDTTLAFAPFLSVILNITPDHLDRYADMEAYARSKMRICQNQGAGQYAVLNDDDRRLAAFHPPEGVLELRYSLSRTHGVHAFLDEGIARAGLPGKAIHAFPLDAYPLPGPHNQENLLAVLLIALVLGVKDDTIQQTIDSFRGLPHRIEYVGEVNGVRFYDDSKATNVEAARAAIAGFDQPVVLIAGGRHKGAEYGPLVEAGRGRVKGAVLLGEARDLMAAAFANAVPLAMAGDMGEAVEMAFSMAEPGDVVLLAPACSSFDMFSDYAQRGNVFQDAVKGLADG